MRETPAEPSVMLIAARLRSSLLFLCVTPCVAYTQRAVASVKVAASSTPDPGPRSTATAAVAIRAAKAPVIDGRGDDAVWATAQMIDAFRTFDPVENGDPRFRTEARVTY